MQNNISENKVSTNHKSGFVNIIGFPNVGKSTLMNALIKDKLSIVTSKAQTTRHRILGIVNGDNYQIVYSDTPGILKPKYKLQETMLKVVSNALEDADILIYVVDPYEEIVENEFTIKINKSKVPVFFILNKIDLIDSEKAITIIEDWKKIITAKKYFTISALKQEKIELLFENILEELPFCPAYFPEDQITDRSERFFVSEIVREKMLLNYSKEIPYSVEILVNEFKEDDDIIRIQAVIYVERESQKAIVIGEKGSAIKKTGIDARADLETFFGKKIFIGLQVKLLKNWRDRQEILSKLGYQ